MNIKTITLSSCLLLVCGAGLAACGSSSSGNAGGCTGPSSASESDACKSCGESHCSSQFSDYCAKGMSAEAAVVSCLLQNCATDCATTGAGGASGTAGASGAGGAGGGVSAGTPTTPNCIALAGCCPRIADVNVMNGCKIFAGQNNDSQCATEFNGLKSLCPAAGGGTGGASGGGSACYIASAFLCDTSSNYVSVCSSAMGTLSAKCPTANLIGCCTGGGGETCSYTGGQQPLTADTCAQIGGTWATTP